MTRLTPEQIAIMKEELTVELADWLMENYDYSPSKALDVLYSSETFDRLQDTSTGFYFQSLGYVSSFLRNEVEYAEFRYPPPEMFLLEKNLLFLRTDGFDAFCAPSPSLSFLILSIHLCIIVKYKCYESKTDC